MLTLPHTLTHPYATAGQAPAFAASWQGKKVLTEVRKTKKFWRAPVGWLGCGGPLVGLRGWAVSRAMCGRVLTAQEKMQKFLLKKQRKRAAKKRVAKRRVANSRNPPLRGPTSAIVTG